MEGGRLISSVLTHALKYNARYRWVALFLAWLVYFCLGMIMVSIPPFLTLIIRDLNLNYSQTGIMLGAWQLTYIAVAFLAGFLIDHVRLKNALAFGVALMSISAALRGFAANFETMLVAVAIFGTGGPLISIGLPKFVASYFLDKERGTAIGIYITGITAGSAFSLAIANTVLLPLVRTWQNALRLHALFGTLVLIIWLLAGREPASLNDQIQSQQSSTFNNVPILLKNRNVWLIVIISISGFFLSNGLRNWLPNILESRGASPTSAGLIASMHPIISIPGSLIIPRLSYRVGSRKRLLILILLLGGMSLFLMRFNSGQFLRIGVIINGFVCGGLFPLMIVFLMELPDVGTKHMGAAVGMLFTAGEMGGFSAPVVIGYLRDLTGSFLAGIDVLILVLEVMVPITFFLKENDIK